MIFALLRVCNVCLVLNVVAVAVVSCCCRLLLSRLSLSWSSGGRRRRCCCCCCHCFFAAALAALWTTLSAAVGFCSILFLGWCAFEFESCRMSCFVVGHKALSRGSKRLRLALTRTFPLLIAGAPDNYRHSSSEVARLQMEALNLGIWPQLMSYLRKPAERHETNEILGFWG